MSEWGMLSPEEVAAVRQAARRGGCEEKVALEWAHQVKTDVACLTNVLLGRIDLLPAKGGEVRFRVNANGVARIESMQRDAEQETDHA